MMLNKTISEQVPNEDQLETLDNSLQCRDNERHLYYWLRKKKEIHAVRKSLSSSEIINDKSDNTYEGEVVCPYGENTSQVDFNYSISNDHSYASNPSGCRGGNHLKREFIEHNESVANQLYGHNLPSQPCITNTINVVRKNDEADRIKLEHLYSKRSLKDISFDSKKGDAGKIELTKQNCGNGWHNIFKNATIVDYSPLNNNGSTHSMSKVSNKNNAPSGLLCKKFVGCSLTNQDSQTEVERLKLKTDRKEVLIDTSKIGSWRILDVSNKRGSDENCSFNVINSKASVKNAPLSLKNSEILLNSSLLKNKLDSKSKMKCSLLSSISLDHSYTYLPANVACTNYFSGSNNSFIYLKPVDKAYKKKCAFKSSKKNCQNRSLFKLSSKSIRLKKIPLKRYPLYRKNFSALKKIKSTNFSKMGFLVSIEDTKFDKRSSNIHETSRSNSEKISDMKNMDSFSKVAGIKENKCRSNKSKLLGTKNKIVPTAIYTKMNKKLSLFTEPDKEMKLVSENRNKNASNTLVLDDHGIGSASKLRPDDSQCIDHCSRRSDRISYEHNYNEDHLWNKQFTNTVLNSNIDVKSSAKLNKMNKKKSSSDSEKPLTEFSTTMKHQVVKKQKVVSGKKVCDFLKSVKPASENYLAVSKNTLIKSEDKELINDSKSNNLGILNDHIDTSDIENCYPETKIDKNPLRLAMIEVPCTPSKFGVKWIDLHEQNRDLKFKKLLKLNDPYESNNQELHATSEFVFSKDKNNVTSSVNIHKQKRLEITEPNKVCADNAQIIDTCSRRSDRIKYEHNYNEDHLWDKLFTNTPLDANISMKNSTIVNELNETKNSIESAKPLAELSIILERQAVTSDSKNYLVVSKNNLQKSDGQELINGMKSKKTGILIDHVTEISDVENFCHDRKVCTNPMKHVSTELPSASSNVGVKRIDHYYQNNDVKFKIQNSSEVTEHNKVSADNTQIIDICSRRSDRINHEHNYNEDHLWYKLLSNTTLDANKPVQVNKLNDRNNSIESGKPLAESSVILQSPALEPDSKNYLLVSKNNLKKSDGQKLTNDLKSNKLGILIDHVTRTSDIENLRHVRKIGKSPVNHALTEFLSASSNLERIELYEQNNDVKFNKLETQDDPCCLNNLDDQLVDCHKKPCKAILKPSKNGSKVVKNLDVKRANVFKTKFASIVKTKKEPNSNNNNLNTSNKRYVRNISKRRKYLKSKKLAIKNQNSRKKNDRNADIYNRNTYLRCFEQNTENNKFNCLDVKKIDLVKHKLLSDKLSENLNVKVKQLCPLDCYVRLHRIDSKIFKNKNSIRLNKINNKLTFMLPDNNFFHKSCENRSVLLNSSHGNVVKACSKVGLNDNVYVSSIDESSKAELNVNVSPIDESSKNCITLSSSTVSVNRHKNRSENLKFVNSVPSRNNDSIVMNLKCSDKHSSVSKYLPGREIGFDKKLCDSLCLKVPVVVVSDEIKKMQFLSYFNLQPVGFNFNKRKLIKSRQCTLNKNYNERVLKRISS